MTVSASCDVEVVVIGGGVVGAAVAHALARRGVASTLCEAEADLALGASGTNSGILHTGFDSKPGELETEMILRSVGLRNEVLAELDVPVVACGAELIPRTEGERETVATVAEDAQRNGVAVSLRADGVLEVPGEAVTDPVAFTRALAEAAAAAGAEVRTGCRVESIDGGGEGMNVRLAGEETLRCRAAVNCAGLRADEIARMAGDASFEVYPRKGEFFVFDPPEEAPLERILLPVPTERTKGVLVFPTVDGKVMAGPTAIDGDDKDDWSVRPEAWDEVMAKVVRAYPALEGHQPIASYAGLRPAGRGVNYVIGPAAGCPRLVNVAAIRSTGLSASLGIGAHVAEILAGIGIEMGPPRELSSPAPAEGLHGRTADKGWWRRAAERSAGAAGPAAERAEVGADS